MTSDDHTHTWEFFTKVADFDGSAEHVEQWTKRYSRGSVRHVIDGKEEY